MTNSDHSYEPHLVISESSLAPEVEWTPRLPGWLLCQVRSGAGYWLHPKLNLELTTGTVLLLSAHAGGSIRASQLGGGLSLCFASMDPGRLTGLVTLGEQLHFETASVREKFPPQVLPPHSPVAGKMQELCACQNRTGCLFRLRLIQLFFEVFGDKLNLEEPRLEPTHDARERLREFLEQTPAADLLHRDLSDLVQIVGCTQRHFSRIFHEVVGMSFRDKHTELRLARALELLATADSKIVDVALESGFQSLSLFNLMFKRHFGVTPGQWRQTQQSGKVTQVRFTAGKNPTTRWPASANVKRVKFR